MIFSVADHIKLIVEGTKTQTRRKSVRYKVDKTYAVQPCRTCKGIKEGRILIIESWFENFHTSPSFLISREDALAEGGYTPEEFEKLYEKLHPGWLDRVAYKFVFIKGVKT